MKPCDIYKSILLIIISALLFVSCQKDKQSQAGIEPQEATYKEPYRPQFHFSPAKNWMNDPNGLVYLDGEYHLFYQYNPFGDTWGHMSWGHAVSKDLLHWQHLPVALEEENNIMIFSGSAVVDINNSSGLGTEDNPPMIAIYTGHKDVEGVVRQDQRIAYSLDNGRSWTKYSSNPVIDEGMADFRDPKVFWHEDSEKWVMAVALSKEQKVRFYGSGNLKEWSLLSEFGPAGAADDLLWECPDLFELTVDGNPDQTKWVLQVDVNPGSVAGGSGGQYFVGEFDGRQFVQDPATRGETLWVDYRRDFYAVQSFSNIPKNDGRRVWLAWMNNWDYAQKIPTKPWRSAMTIPREVTIKNTDRGYRLVQKPVQEMQQLRTNHIEMEELLLSPGSNIEQPDFQGKAYELIVDFDAGDAEQFGLKVRQGNDEQTVIGYDVKKQQLFLDRRNSGQVAFDTTFASLDQAPLALGNNRIKLHVFIDWSSVEIFANGGEVAITDRIFPSSGSSGLEFFSEGGTAKVLSADIWDLQSIWTDSQN